MCRGRPRSCWSAREAQQAGRAFVPEQQWVSYDDVSPLLRRAVLVAEDDAFFSHSGLDWNEIRASARRDLAAGRVVRGGSTITQQLAKNLYLGDERSLARKFKEMILAVRMERALGKRRIFELYLNEIEWGDGVFGIEAAARRDFGVSASALNPRQAVLLAAVIINPRRYSAISPEPRIQRRAGIIASRLHRRGALDDREYQLALGVTPPPGPLDWLRNLFGVVSAGGYDAARHERGGYDQRLSRPQAPSACFTRRETALTSARPLTFAITAPITRPMSFGPAAPLAVIASRTCARISSSDSDWGR